MAKNYKQLANDIVKYSGGVDNISSVSHCMTRLRLQLKDSELFQTDKIKQLPGVLNVIVQNGEYQIVIGQDVPSLYEEFQEFDIKMDVISESEKPNNISKKSFMNTIMSFISGTFSPVIPILVAGGLTGAVLTILTNFMGVSPDSGTYTVVYAINQATFYFLPIFIGFSSATRLKSNGYLGGFLGAILLFSTINNAEGLSFLGLPVAQVAYNSTVFPVILGVLFMSLIYKFLQKHLPVFLRTIFVPLITILITVPITLIVLGPIGGYLGTLLADGVLSMYRISPAIAVMIIGIATPLMVFFGMNNATYPVVFALIAEVGSDPLICTGMAPANVAVGGACLAVALLAKNVNDRSVSISSGVTALCGITEPAVYGVLFPKTFPLIGAMIGGGIGGLIAGIFGMTQYVVSTPGFISLPAYINPDGTSKNLIVSIIVMLIALIISFVATYVIGKHKFVNEKHESSLIRSVGSGKLIPIEDVKDEMFSSKSLGNGVAIELKDEHVCAPVSGVLTTVFPTGHAFGVTTEEGIEILCHIGIDTVQLNGRGFTILKKQGTFVHSGDAIIDVDLSLLDEGYDLTTVIVVTNENNKEITFVDPKDVKSSDVIATIK